MVSKAIKQIYREVYFSALDIEDTSTSMIGHVERVIGIDSPLFESVFVLPASMFALYWAGEWADLSTLRGDMSSVPKEATLALQFWSTVVFFTLGYIVFATEHIVSPMVILLAFLTSLCGLFIVTPYAISCFHVFTTLTWAGIFDLVIRTDSILDFPGQLFLACLLLVSTLIRSYLGNHVHYSSMSYRFGGIPVLLVMYWGVEIPFCELFQHMFSVELSVCQYSSQGKNSGVLAVLFLQWCHIIFSFVMSYMFSYYLNASNSLEGCAEDSECENVSRHVLNVTKQQKRASRSAHRVERGRCRMEQGRCTSNSVSSTDSESSSSSISSPIGSDFTSRGQVEERKRKRSESSTSSSGEFLPTLSLLSTLSTLTSLMSPFGSDSKDLSKAQIEASSSADSSDEKPKSSSAHLPSSAELIHSLPSFSHLPNGRVWELLSYDSSRSDCAGQSLPHFSPSLLPSQRHVTNCRNQVPVQTFQQRDEKLEKISEEEALDIVQKGLMHVKSLRAI